MKRAVITYSLISLNFTIFLGQISLGYQENLDQLIAWGAVVPDLVFAGEWGRLIKANFLHFNTIHLVSNLVALYYLGPLVETSLGSKRYLSIYLASGILSMTCFSLVAWYQNDLDQVLLGASGAVMGVFGALTVILGRIYWRERQAFILKKLQLIGLLLGIQFIFDFWHPQVSLLTHLWGFLWGIILTYWLG